MKYFVYRVCKAFCIMFFKVFNRLEVVGSEHVPERGGVIIAANHVSYLDPPLIGAALSRRPTYIAKEELFNIPIIGKFIKLFSFSVKRDKVQPSTIKEAVSRLKKGEVVILFPEGERSAEGTLLDAKRGIGMIVAISKMPVIPVLIEGTDKALPVGAWFLKPAKVRVIFGAPVTFNTNEKGKDYQERISREVMERIKELRVKS